MVATYYNLYFFSLIIKKKYSVMVVWLDVCSVLCEALHSSNSKWDYLYDISADRLCLHMWGQLYSRMNIINVPSSVKIQVSYMFNCLFLYVVNTINLYLFFFCMKKSYHLWNRINSTLCKFVNTFISFFLARILLKFSC